MPKLKDTRKAKKTPIYNGWTDEKEPRSPLADLFGYVVPTLQALKKKRGTIQFPPKPPHPEMRAPPSRCAGSLGKKLKTDPRALFRPEITDFGCERSVLEEVKITSVGSLASQCKFRTATKHPLNQPIEVEDEDEFYEILEGRSTIYANNSGSSDPLERVTVVLFHAQWCPKCETLAPVFRVYANRTPVVTFVKVDVDECHKLSHDFDVEKLPHTVVMKGISTSRSGKDARAVFIGGGPKWRNHMDETLGQLLSKEQTKELEEFRERASGILPPAETETLELGRVLETAERDVEELARFPLSSIASKCVVSRSRAEMGLAPVSSHLPFDVTSHESASTAVAQSMLQRMREDVAAFAESANSGKSPRIVQLPDEVVRAYFTASSSAKEEEAMRKAAADIQENVLTGLRNLRSTDAEMVKSALPLLERAVNHVEILPEDDPIVKRRKLDFLLKRSSGQEPNVWMEFLYGCLLSTKSVEDLLSLNPFLPPASAEEIFKITRALILRSNRIGSASRCVAASISLLELIESALSLPRGEEREKAKATTLPRIVQAAESLAGLLSSKRHYVKKETKGERAFDPRFMVFEFVWNLSLRQKQVEIVEMFRSNLKENKMRIKQMIMGAGKTTVVAPLLALMLADGKSLVVSVVPKALLEMSRTRMRETFSQIMSKRIYTLRFDRSTKIHPSMFKTLENAAKNRGIVVATPTSIKSILLSYLENLEILGLARAGKYKYESAEVVARKCQELSRVLNLFQSGVMLLDEVDLILHPLKSELNFPKGEKFDLDVSESGERWSLPIHLIDAIFHSETQRATAFESRGMSVDILKRLSAAVEEGYRVRSFQRLPHITLLNQGFYAKKIKPIMAEWTYLWLQKQHLHGIDRDEAVKYLLTGAAARSEGKQKEDALEERAKRAVQGSVEHHHLTTALAYARRNRELTDELYEAEERFESFAAESARRLQALDAEIAAITKAIKEAEYPKDDSLDNAVVVWFSHAFAPSHSANASPSKLASIRNLAALCSELESSGMTVKRCDSSEEAAARCRELQSNGHLRCLVVGGGEGVDTCGPDCEESHEGNCVVCGQGWGSHNGHNCSSGARGSWPIDDGQGDEDSLEGDAEAGDDEGEADENAALIRSLTSKSGSHVVSTGLKPLPAARACVFAGHAFLSEGARMTYWRLGVHCAEDDAKLQAWCDQIRDWSEEKEEGEERAVEE